jgi:hypothetical protein
VAQLYQTRSAREPKISRFFMAFQRKDKSSVVKDASVQSLSVQGCR